MHTSGSPKKKENSYQIVILSDDALGLYSSLVYSECFVRFKYICIMPILLCKFWRWKSDFSVLCFSNKISLEIGSKMNLKSPAKDLKFTEFIIINFMSITFKQNMEILTISLDACFEVYFFFIIKTCLFLFLKVLIKFYRKKFHFDYQFISFYRM